MGEDRTHSSDEETEAEKRERQIAEYKRGYERARREIMRRSVSVMREIPGSKETSNVDAEFYRDDEKRRRDRERARKLRRREDEDELDDRDDDMVDDIVDILYSRK